MILSYSLCGRKEPDKIRRKKELLVGRQELGAVSQPGE
jgi:hypothetical protein